METRKLKAQTIVATGKITRGPGFYIVMGSAGLRYRVVLDGLFPSCTCPDFEMTGRPCKHMHAARLWEEQAAVFAPDAKPVDPNTLPKVPRKTYPQDWPNYNKAQNREKGHFQDLLAELCRAIPEPAPKGGKKGGRPPVPLRDAAFLAAFKVYCGFSARRFVCDLQDAHGRGHLSAPVCHNSVLKALENPALTPILHDLIRRSAAPLAAVETDFAVDSSGFCTNSYTRWFDVKYGEKQQQTWVKPHIVTGVKTNCVTAVEIHDKRTNDCNVLPSLVETTAKTFTIGEVSADKAYSAGTNFNAVDRHGGVLYAAFKNNATGSVGGLFEKMYHLFSLNREAYLSHYHKRSNVESTFSAVKRKFGEMVRSKTDTAQRNEVLCKFICQNVCCLISAAYELGLPILPNWEETDEGERSIIPFPGLPINSLRLPTNPGPVN